MMSPLNVSRNDFHSRRTSNCRTICKLNVSKRTPDHFKVWWWWRSNGQELELKAFLFPPPKLTAEPRRMFDLFGFPVIHLVKIPFNDDDRTLKAFSFLFRLSSEFLWQMSITTWSLQQLAAAADLNNLSLSHLEISAATSWWEKFRVKNESEEVEAKSFLSHGYEIENCVSWGEG